MQPSLLRIAALYMERIGEEKTLFQELLCGNMQYQLAHAVLIGSAGQVVLSPFAAALIKQGQATSESRRSFFLHTVPLSKITFECVCLFCIFKWF